MFFDIPFWTNPLYILKLLLWHKRPTFWFGGYVLPFSNLHQLCNVNLWYIYFRWCTEVEQSYKKYNCSIKQIRQAYSYFVNHSVMHLLRVDQQLQHDFLQTVFISECWSLEQYPFAARLSHCPTRACVSLFRQVISGRTGNRNEDYNLSFDSV